MLREFISERSSAIPDFAAHARVIALESLQSDDPMLILKGIHVLAAVGTDEEMVFVKSLVSAKNQDVARHARTALFERGVKNNQKEPNQHLSTTAQAKSGDGETSGER